MRVLIFYDDFFYLCTNIGDQDSEFINWNDYKTNLVYFIPYSWCDHLNGKEQRTKFELWIWHLFHSSFYLKLCTRLLPKLSESSVEMMINYTFLSYTGHWIRKCVHSYILRIWYLAKPNK